ncbi:MAG: LPS export ABC transporter periplasmic protein LptC [Fidelibacterota bacterium]
MMKIGRRGRVVRFLSLFLIWTACTHQESPLTGESRKGKPDMESWVVTLTFTEQGKIRAVVKADHLQKYNDRQYAQLDGNVHVDFFDEREKHTSLLLSESAEVEETSNFMQAFGQVTVISDSGITLFSDTLSLDHNSGLIFTDDSVMITTTQHDTLYGVGFESDLEMESWTILKPSGVTTRETN